MYKFVKIVQTAGGYMIIYNPRYYTPNIDTGSGSTMRLPRLDVAY